MKDGKAFFDFLPGGGGADGLTPLQEQFKKLANEGGNLVSILVQLRALKFESFIDLRDVLAGMTAASIDFRTEIEKTEDQLGAVVFSISDVAKSSQEYKLAVDNLQQKLAFLRDEQHRSSFAAKAWNDDVDRSKEILKEVETAFNPVNAALREYNKQLIEVDRLLSKDLISQEQFNQRLTLMQIELANNISAFRTMGETISSAFAAGIVAGDKMSEVLQNIGRQLVQAALKALILKAIMASFGAGIVATSNAEFAAQNPGEVLPAGSGSSSLNNLAGGEVPVSRGTASRSASSGMTINVDARGADPGAEIRVEQAIRAMGDSAVRQAVAITTERSLRS